MFELQIEAKQKEHSQEEQQPKKGEETKFQAFTGKKYSLKWRHLFILFTGYLWKSINMYTF